MIKIIFKALKFKTRLILKNKNDPLPSSKRYGSEKGCGGKKERAYCILVRKFSVRIKQKFRWTKK